MSESISHFDSDLGGTQSIPTIYNISDFIKNRMEEIMMLTETIKEPPFRGQTFQRLPKHMRRRQMSHYIKRLPRRLQRPYLLSLKDGLPAPTKCNSRKYRRRPSNLLLEYNRRQKTHVWLETHIWHAKRFHMSKKWGYSLPEKPTNKSFRACYRGLSQHCLITDISYYSCIEIKGPESTLLKGLMQCVSSDNGLTFGAKMYLNGSREGIVTLFHPNMQPYKVIGNVSFIWKPMCQKEFHRVIWIWVHPLMHDEVVECFKNLFELSAGSSSTCEIYDDINGNNESIIVEKFNYKKNKVKKEKNSKKEIEKIKLKPKNVPFVRTPKFINTSKSVTMVLLKDTLNRFQLSGPLSQAIIAQSFHPISVSSVKSDISTSVGCSGFDVENKKRKIGEVEVVVSKKMKKAYAENAVECFEKRSTWWKQFYHEENNLQCMKIQNEFYEIMSNCSSSSDIPSGLVLSLVIADPRLEIPSKREKAVPQQKDPNPLYEDFVSVNLSHGPIWYPEIRDEVSFTKLSTHQINEAKSKKIVPGFNASDIFPDEVQSKIPILLVQRPGLSNCNYGKLGLGSGWDVIAPAGFGMPLWLSFILRGARAGGLRETEMTHFECKTLSNFLPPDSAAGKAESESKFLEHKERYFKLPPSKRPNYLKLGIPCPFDFKWNLLTKDWAERSNGIDDAVQTKEKWKVLRNRHHLNELFEMITNCKKINYVNVTSLIKVIGSDCLVPVMIEFKGKGHPKDRALICLPEMEDFETALPPSEPCHMDENEKLRKTLKLEHLKKLKSLRRKRRKFKLKLKEDFANDNPNKKSWKDILKSNAAPSQQHSTEFNEKMQSLWVPELKMNSEIINTPSRKILGFVVKGDFSFAKSYGVALGYVNIVGLLELLKINEGKKGLKVLVRNNNNVQYKVGNMKILCE